MLPAAGPSFYDRSGAAGREAAASRRHEAGKSCTILDLTQVSRSLSERLSSPGAALSASALSAVVTIVTLEPLSAVFGRATFHTSNVSVPCWLPSASSMRQSWVRAHARRRGRVPGVLQGA